MRKLGSRRQALGGNRPNVQLRLVVSLDRTFFGSCAQAVYKLREVCGPSRLVLRIKRASAQAMGISTYFCTQRFPILSELLPTGKSMNLPLLFCHLSPLSTGPIKTTTKYISNIGVSTS